MTGAPPGTCLEKSQGTVWARTISPATSLDSGQGRNYNVISTRCLPGHHDIQCAGRKKQPGAEPSTLVWMAGWEDVFCDPPSARATDSAPQMPA